MTENLKDHPLMHYNVPNWPPSYLTNDFRQELLKDSESTCHYLSRSVCAAQFRSQNYLNRRHDLRVPNRGRRRIVARRNNPCLPSFVGARGNVTRPPLAQFLGVSRLTAGGYVSRRTHI